MSFATTTVSAAVAVADNSVVVASATGLAAGMFGRIDGEFVQIAKNYSSGTTIPVQRGVDGSQTTTHKASANITFGLASDFASPPVGLELGVTNPTTPAFPMFSYSAAGAVSAVQGIHIINGTGALAMTLANPTKDQDGQLMIVAANGKAAHTLTYTAGLGNGGAAYDVGTFSATLAGGCILMAVNGFWVLIANGIATATGATGAPLFA